MGNYLDDYKNRLNALGSTIYDQEVELGRSYFEDYIGGAPNAFDVLVNQMINMRVTIQDSSEIDKKNETKTVLSRYNERLHIGDIIAWNGSNWLAVVEETKSLDICSKVQILQCNNVLKFYDDTNALHELPCIINGLSQSLEQNILVNSSSNRFKCLVQYNDDSRLIKLSPNPTRFIINGTNIKVVAIDNVSNITDDKGYIVLTLESDLIQKQDDVVNNVADNTNKTSQNVRTEKTLW